MASGNARAHAGVTGVGRGRRRIGEDAKVNVAQRAELRLKHDILAGSLCVVHILCRVADIGRELFAELLAPGKHIGQLVGVCAVDVLNREVLPFEDRGKALFQILGVQ